MTNKEQLSSDQKPKEGAITLAIKNNPCGKCRAMGLPGCKCGGGGGGASRGSGGSDSSETKNKDDSYVSNQAISTSDQIAITAVKEFDKFKTSWLQSQLFSDSVSPIEYEAGFFSIKSDKLHGNLTLQIKSGLSEADMEEAYKFLEIVKSEFNEFKKQLTEQGIQTDKFTADLKDNKLEIHIHPANPKHYDTFIKRLEDKNLLPVPNPERAEKKEALQSNKENKQQISNRNPFSTRLERK